MRCIMILCAFLLALAGVRAADDNKEVLFNTFYLDGDKITYVLVLKPDRSFKLYGPKDQQIAGKFKASTEHLTLTAGDTKRFFHFDSKGDDLKLGQRENDAPSKDNLLGEMPPTKGALLRTVYVSERNWKKKGLPVFVPPGEKRAEIGEEKPVPPPQLPDVKAQEIGDVLTNKKKSVTPETVPVKQDTQTKSETALERKPETPVVVEKKPETPPTVEKKPETPPSVAGKPADKATLPGTYIHRANLFVSETLVFKDDGAFSYKDSNNSTVDGTYTIKEAIVTLTAGEVVREFSAMIDNNVLLLTRTDKDNPKFKNDLASMSPTVLKEAKYERK